MHILFEINHPAHFHLFKISINSLIANGNQVTILAKSNHPIPELLNTFPNWTVIYVGSKGKNLFYKIFKQFFFTCIALKAIITRKIDVCVGVSITMPQAAFLTGRKSLVLDDDDQNVTPIFALLSHTFATKVMSPNSVKRGLSGKYINYPGFHELAYLHPNVFAPRIGVINDLHLDITKKIFLVRFNSFTAHHDIGEKGLSHTQREILVNHLLKLGQVVISSEANIDPIFTKHQFALAPPEIHNLMAFSTLYVGESQTMASEAAILGVPSVRINSFKNRLSSLNELETQYGLLFSYLPSELNDAILKIDELLTTESYQNRFESRNRLLNEKISLSPLITSTIYGICK